MYDEIFNEINLHVVELPIELAEELPLYSGYLKELPMISATGNSRQEMYRKLAASYQVYAEERMAEQVDEQEEMTSSLLNADQLLKYYDGETFDGFNLPD